jgi:hypothetical protein
VLEASLLAKAEALSAAEDALAGEQAARGRIVAALDAERAAGEAERAQLAAQLTESQARGLVQGWGLWKGLIRVQARRGAPTQTRRLAQVEAEGRASAHGRERAELAAALARAEAGLADERRQVRQPQPQRHVRAGVLLPGRAAGLQRFRVCCRARCQAGPGAVRPVGRSGPRLPAVLWQRLLPHAGACLLSCCVTPLHARAVTRRAGVLKCPPQATAAAAAAAAERAGQQAEAERAASRAAAALEAVRAQARVAAAAAAAERKRLQQARPP